LGRPDLLSNATVMLWGTPIGYVSMSDDERFARFEYDPDFAAFAVEPAPLKMPVRANQIYRFEDLHPRSFHGLPGMLADSLPDKYGNRLIDIWLAKTGRSADTFNAVDRLCYTGVRGMGALEYKPAIRDQPDGDKRLQVEQLVELASIAFASKEALDARLAEKSGDQGLLDILSIGTSAGGARAKAIIAFNPKTREVRSGQVGLGAGFEHWLIKFDGVEFNGDWGIADPTGYGLLEFSYYQMAKHCDIEMEECRILPDNGRHHFMTRRFDRDRYDGKLFVQTFGALAHYDYWESGAYSYEQLFMTMKQLKLPQADIEQQFRRTIFNLVGCNQDDHVKNISFMMDRSGEWRLSPAYDMCHAEGSLFTQHHQLSVNGKLSDFDREDIKQLAAYAGLPRGRENKILEQTVDAFSRWAAISRELEIPEQLHDHVVRTLRLKW
jgi:serine/threonine-protein kinase HipA